MHTRHFIAAAVIFAFEHVTFAADRCQQISDVVAQAAAMKPKLLEQLKKDPQKGTLGEPWRWFALTLSSDFEKLRVPGGRAAGDIQIRCNAPLLEKGRSRFRHLPRVLLPPLQAERAWLVDRSARVGSRKVAYAVLGYGGFSARVSGLHGEAPRQPLVFATNEV